MSIHPEDAELVAKQITDLQESYNYSKIFLKIPKSLKKIFCTADTTQEAEIPEFYQGTEDALFLSSFFSPERARDETIEEIQKSIQKAQKFQKSSPDSRELKTEDWNVRQATESDVPDLCKLYKKTFETYPFPIHESDYLKKLMEGGVLFYVIEDETGIIAAGSCETERFASATEMSDLAVEHAYRGNGLSKYLLQFMEQKIKDAGIKTAYTICRAVPFPVNRLFGGSDYQFGGTLIKNTNICGTFESMNVWHKKL